MAKGIKPSYTKELLIEQVSKMSVREMAEYWNICDSAMQRVLRKFNIEYPLLQRHVWKDEMFFDNIDSEIKAYLLGFFVADGSIHNNRISLCLANTDLYISKLFQEYISPESNINIIHNTKGAKARKPQAIIRISSKYMCETLAKYGIVERKTFKPIPLPQMTDELTWHFIRGYFDGDGCISYHGRKKNIKRITIANGDSKILIDIIEFLSKYGIQSYLDEYKKNNHFRLHIYKQDYIKIFEKCMYHNSKYYLSRKRNKFNLDNTELTEEIKEASVV